MKNKEIEELLDYYQKEIDKYEETKQYLMEKYGYDEETIDNISQHQRYKNNKLLLSYIETLKNRNKELYEGFMATQEELTDYATKNEQLENNMKEIIKKINFYETTEWGLHGYDMLQEFRRILKGDSDDTR